MVSLDSGGIEVKDINTNIKLLYAKDAIFSLIGQFCCPVKFDDGELYIYDYCESALERAFNVLEIEEDYIPLMDFCKLWESNSRALWVVNNSGAPYSGATAEDRYEIFKEKFER